MEKKIGFLGKQATFNDTQNTGDYFECGMWALIAGRIGEAYSMFMMCEKNDAAVSFNIGLALHRGGLNRDALSILQKARRELSVFDASESAVNIPEALREAEDKSDGYLNPMAKNFPKLRPTPAKIQILRVEADVLFALELYEDVKKIIPLLSGRQYSNINNILYKLNGE